MPRSVRAAPGSIRGLAARFNPPRRGRLRAAGYQGFFAAGHPVSPAADLIIDKSAINSKTGGGKGRRQISWCSQYLVPTKLVGEINDPLHLVWLGQKSGSRGQFVGVDDEIA